MTIAELVHALPAIRALREQARLRLIEAEAELRFIEARIVRIQREAEA